MTSSVQEHIPTFGDHYSPRTGSAVMTVIANLARVRAATSRRTRILVREDTWQEVYPFGDVERFPVVSEPAHWRRRLDVLTGALVLRRVQAEDVAKRSLMPSLSGEPRAVLVHNAPSVAAIVPSQHLTCLYAHNRLFATYTRREISRTLRHVDAVVCVSRYLADRFVADLPRADGKRVKVALNGVDTRMFHPAAAARTGPGVVVGLIGRMTPQKGAHVLLEACALLPPGLDFEVRIIGSSGFDAGIEASAYEQSLRQAAVPLGDRVSFLPFQPRPLVPQLLRDMDILVVPSQWPEPAGLVVLEGLASGLAVVATDVGGIPEMLGSPEGLVAQRDVRALADALHQLITDREALAERKAQGRRFAESMTWERTDAALDEALGGTP